MLRFIRIILAFLFFASITLLLLDVSGTLVSWLGWTAKVQLIPAVLSGSVLIVLMLAVLTLVFGRIYCSVICPLGVFQDLIAWVHRRMNRKYKYCYSQPLTWLRYALLFVFTALAVIGLTSLAALIAPYSTYGRIVTQLFQPLWVHVNNALASFALTADAFVFHATESDMWSWPAFIITVLSFLLIGVLAWHGGRTWCNTVCPVGTVLGILSRRSLFQIRFLADRCASCGQCARNCKASCINVAEKWVDTDRCVACGDCLSVCDLGAITYSLSPRVAESSNKTPVDASKRAFLAATGVVAATALAQKSKQLSGAVAVLQGKKKPMRHTPLTPPGSMSARNMQRHCTACQLCISKCPNHVLHPDMQLDKFLQPAMSYERGWCRPGCTLCSQVCPTGAIRPITRKEKAVLQIGHAVWVESNCLPLTDDVACGRCANSCPTKAITMIPYDAEDYTSPLIPSVDAETCIGCGACEHVCPATPFPSIYVEGHSVHGSR